MGVVCGLPLTSCFRFAPSGFWSFLVLSSSCPVCSHAKMVEVSSVAFQGYCVSEKNILEEAQWWTGPGSGIVEVVTLPLL